MRLPYSPPLVLPLSTESATTAGSSLEPSSASPDVVTAIGLEDGAPGAVARR